MSPAESFRLPIPIGFPRVSGDEPPTRTIDGDLIVFSPRERG